MTESEKLPLPQWNVLVVEDERMMATLLSMVLKNNTRINEVRVATCLAEASSLLQGIDLLFIDLHLPDGDGLSFLEEARKVYEDLRAIIVSGTTSPEMLKRVMLSGIQGYLDKADSSDYLDLVIEKVVNGDVWFSEVVLSKMRNLTESEEVKALKLLSDRERDVLRCHARGHSLQDTAEHLGIAYNTVRNHRRSIMSKLGLFEPVQLVRFALKTGLVG